MNAHPEAMPPVLKAEAGGLRISCASCTVIAIAFVMAIGWLDFVTGDFSIAVLYLVPVFYATWFADRTIGYFVAGLSGAANLLSELALKNPDGKTLIPFWNAGMLVAMYGTTVLLLAKLRGLQLDLEHRIEERTASLVRANQELEAANLNLIETKALADRHEKLASLGVLAAGVAHEIRNPLTAIKIRVFMLKRRLEEETEAAEDTAIIESEVLRLERIVGDFLLFAKPGEPEFASLTAREVMHDIQILLGPELAGNEIELLVDDQLEDVQFRGDAQQLQQVLINLVHNAAECIVRQGRVTMRARAAHRLLHGEDQDVVVIEVQDTGSGIPEAVKARLFDPFFTTKPAGTGLGLSIALRILEKHGGSIEIESEPGRGTTFALILPVTAANGPKSS